MIGAERAAGGPNESPKVPQTASIRELAEFSGTHDLTEFADEHVRVVASTPHGNRLPKLRQSPG
jgi:hypothetical protein